MWFKAPTQPSPASGEGERNGAIEIQAFGLADKDG